MVGRGGYDTFSAFGGSYYDDDDDDEIDGARNAGDVNAAGGKDALNSSFTAGGHNKNSSNSGGLTASHDNDDDLAMSGNDDDDEEEDEDDFDVDTVVHRGSTGKGTHSLSLSLRQRSRRSQQAAAAGTGVELGATAAGTKTRKQAGSSKSKTGSGKGGVKPTDSVAVGVPGNASGVRSASRQDGVSVIDSDFFDAEDENDHVKDTDDMLFDHDNDEDVNDGAFFDDDDDDDDDDDAISGSDVDDDDDDVGANDDASVQAELELFDLATLPRNRPSLQQQQLQQQLQHLGQQLASESQNALVAASHGHFPVTSSITAQATAAAHGQSAAAVHGHSTAAPHGRFGARPSSHRSNHSTASSSAASIPLSNISGSAPSISVTAIPQQQGGHAAAAAGAPHGGLSVIGTGTGTPRKTGQVTADKASLSVTGLGLGPGAAAVTAALRRNGTMSLSRKPLRGARPTHYNTGNGANDNGDGGGGAMGLDNSLENAADMAFEFDGLKSARMPRQSSLKQQQQQEQEQMLQQDDDDDDDDGVDPVALWGRTQEIQPQEIDSARPNFDSVPHQDEFGQLHIYALPPEPDLQYQQHQQQMYQMHLHQQQQQQQQHQWSDSTSHEVTPVHGIHANHTGGSHPRGSSSPWFGFDRLQSVEGEDSAAVVATGGAIVGPAGGGDDGDDDAASLILTPAAAAAAAAAAAGTGVTGRGSFSSVGRVRTTRARVKGITLNPNAGSSNAHVGAGAAGMNIGVDTVVSTNAAGNSEESASLLRTLLPLQLTHALHTTTTAFAKGRAREQAFLVAATAAADEVAVSTAVGSAQLKNNCKNNDGRCAASPVLTAAAAASLSRERSRLLAALLLARTPASDLLARGYWRPLRRSLARALTATAAAAAPARTAAFLRLLPGLFAAAIAEAAESGEGESCADPDYSDTLATQQQQPQELDGTACNDATQLHNTGVSVPGFDAACAGFGAVSGGGIEKALQIVGIATRLMSQIWGEGGDADKEIAWLHHKQQQSQQPHAEPQSPQSSPSSASAQWRVARCYCPTPSRAGRVLLPLPFMLTDAGEALVKAATVNGGASSVADAEDSSVFLLKVSNGPNSNSDVTVPLTPGVHFKFLPSTGLPVSSAAAKSDGNAAQQSAIQQTQSAGPTQVLGSPVGLPSSCYTPELNLNVLQLALLQQQQSTHANRASSTGSAAATVAFGVGSAPGDATAYLPTVTPPLLLVLTHTLHAMLARLTSRHAASGLGPRVLTALLNAILLPLLRLGPARGTFACRRCGGRGAVSAAALYHGISADQANPHSASGVGHFDRDSDSYLASTGDGRCAPWAARLSPLALLCSIDPSATWLRRLLGPASLAAATASALGRTHSWRVESSASTAAAADAAQAVEPVLMRVVPGIGDGRIITARVLPQSYYNLTSSSSSSSSTTAAGDSDAHSSKSGSAAASDAGSSSASHVLNSVHPAPSVVSSSSYSGAPLPPPPAATVPRWLAPYHHAAPHTAAVSNAAGTATPTAAGSVAGQTENGSEYAAPKLEFSVLTVPGVALLAARLCAIATPSAFALSPSREQDKEPVGGGFVGPRAVAASGAATATTVLLSSPATAAVLAGTKLPMPQQPPSQSADLVSVAVLTDTLHSRCVTAVAAAASAATSALRINAAKAHKQRHGGRGGCVTALALRQAGLHTLTAVLTSLASAAGTVVAMPVIPHTNPETITTVSAVPAGVGDIADAIASIVFPSSEANPTLITDASVVSAAALALVDAIVANPAAAAVLFAPLSRSSRPSASNASDVSSTLMSLFAGAHRSFASLLPVSANINNDGAGSVGAATATAAESACAGASWSAVLRICDIYLTALAHCSSAANATLSNAGNSLVTATAALLDRLIQARQKQPQNHYVFPAYNDVEIVFSSLIRATPNLTDQRISANSSASSSSKDVSDTSRVVATVASAAALAAAQSLSTRAHLRRLSAVLPALLTVTSRLSRLLPLALHRRRGHSAGATAAAAAARALALAGVVLRPRTVARAGALLSSVTVAAAAVAAAANAAVRASSNGVQSDGTADPQSSSRDTSGTSYGNMMRAFELLAAAPRWAQQRSLHDNGGAAASNPSAVVVATESIDNTVPAEKSNASVWGLLAGPLPAAAALNMLALYTAFYNIRRWTKKIESKCGVSSKPIPKHGKSGHNGDDCDKSFGKADGCSECTESFLISKQTLNGRNSRGGKGGLSGRYAADAVRAVLTSGLSQDNAKASTPNAASTSDTAANANAPDSTVSDVVASALASLGQYSNNINSSINTSGATQARARAAALKRMRSHVMSLMLPQWLRPIAAASSTAAAASAAATAVVSATPVSGVPALVTATRNSRVARTVSGRLLALAAALLRLKLRRAPAAASATAVVTALARCGRRLTAPRLAARARAAAVALVVAARALAALRNLAIAPPTLTLRMPVSTHLEANPQLAITAAATGAPLLTVASSTALVPAASSVASAEFVHSHGQRKPPMPRGARMLAAFARAAEPGAALAALIDPVIITLLTAESADAAARDTTLLSTLATECNSNSSSCADTSHGFAETLSAVTVNKGRSRATGIVMCCWLLMQLRPSSLAFVARRLLLPLRLVLLVPAVTDATVSAVANAITSLGGLGVNSSLQTSVPATTAARTALRELAKQVIGSVTLVTQSANAPTVSTAQRRRMALSLLVCADAALVAMSA